MGKPETIPVKSKDWVVNHRADIALVVLSDAELSVADVTDGACGAQQLMVANLPPEAGIPDSMLQQVGAVVLEIRPDMPSSIARFSRLRQSCPYIPVIAAMRDADLDVVRMLLREGARDVVALPLVRSKLVDILDEIFAEADMNGKAGDPAVGTLTAVLQSLGGVGATTVATNLASELANRKSSERGVCLVDLDLQFGEAGSYLGVNNSLTIADLLAAGSRIDRELLRSVVTRTVGGLHLLQAPLDILPLEETDQDQVLRIVELARAEYEHVIVDLPTDWTNWSLSLLAEADSILLVIALSINSLRQAKRQLRLLASQGISPKKVHIIANRVEQKLFHPIDLSAAEHALGAPIEFTIHNDYRLISAAQDQGELIREVNAKSKIVQDIDNLIPVVTGREAR